MSLIDARKCDYCAATADRTKKEDRGWIMLGHMSDDGSPRTQEVIDKHFCNKTCLGYYLENVTGGWRPGERLEPVS